MQDAQACLERSNNERCLYPWSLHIHSLAERLHPSSEHLGSGPDRAYFDGLEVGMTFGALAHVAFQHYGLPVAKSAGEYANAKEAALRVNE
jgi:hypothetical protein